MADVLAPVYFLRMAKTKRRRRPSAFIIILTLLILAWLYWAQHRQGPGREGVSEFQHAPPASASLSEDQDAKAEESSPARAAELDVKGQRRLMLANPVGIYNNSDTSTVAELIRLAKSSVDIEIYEMNDPQVRQALRDVMRAKVRVRVVKEPKPIGESCDPWGTQADSENCSDQQGLVREIKASGGDFVPFRKETLCGRERKGRTCYQHGKMMIIDRNRFALLSTGNFNSSNLCDLAYRPKACNRDYTYITRDQVVLKALNEIFENDFRGRRYDLAAILSEPGVSERLTVSPYSQEPLVDFIRSAKKRIQLQNQYINPNSGLPEVLIEKAKKGVAVEVQLADVCTYGHVRDKQAYDLYLMFAAMEDAGVKIRMFNKAHKIDGRPGYLHAKAIVIDGERAWVGSVNGSATSLRENREFGIFFTHPQRVKFLAGILGHDFKHEGSQAWRDSLRCRNVSYQSREATLKDDADYGHFIQEKKKKASGSSSEYENED
jgi:phosphatidylserine/phosphatidylglycerophosphate/cardiolipin synthase-like enzyme